MAQSRCTAATRPSRLLWDGDSRGSRMAVSSFGKWLYGAIFVLFVPIALTAWAMATADTVSIPAIVSPTFGLTIATAGGFLLTAGMANLWVYGGGLPMNAYPPPRYVAQGIFRLLPHPIYTGFTMLCVGVSIAVGSASGLWLVSPIVALSCAALVLGYERHDLREPRSAWLVTPACCCRGLCSTKAWLPWERRPTRSLRGCDSSDPSQCWNGQRYSMPALTSSSGSLRFS